MKFSVYFEGFYNSCHNQQIDSMLETYFIDENGESQDLPENIDYTKIFLAYSIEYVSAFKEHLNEEHGLDINLRFVKLQSPKEYNFETDHIVCEITWPEHAKVFDAFSSNLDFVEYVNKESASRSGFISFYEGINAVLANPEIFLAYVGKYIISNDSQEINSVLETHNIHELLHGIDFIRV